MSIFAAATEPIIEDEKPQERVTLSVVPEYKASKKKISKTAIAGFAILALVASGVFTVVINVHISKNQYEMITLKNRLAELNQQNEALTSHVTYLDSPQMLHKKATDLGMVSPKMMGLVDLSTGNVIHSEIAQKDSQREIMLTPLPNKPDLTQ